MSDSEFKNRLEQFRQKRTEQNEKVLDLGHLGIKRFFNMDANTYRDGALDKKPKNCLASSLPVYYAATIVSIITSNNVQKQDLRKMKLWMH